MKFKVVVIFALASPAFGTISHIQSTSCTSYSASVGCPYVSNVTANSLLIVQATNGTGVGITCSDGTNGTYSKVFATDKLDADGTGTQAANIFYVLSSGAGATTVTCSRAGASVVEINIHEYSVTASPAVFDTASSSAPLVDKGSPVSGNITTTVANEFVFSSATGIGGAPSGGSGTERLNGANNFYYATQDTVVASAGTYQSTFTQGTADSWVMMQAAFKETTSNKRKSSMNFLFE